MKTMLSTFLLMVGMLALIAANKAWRDYGENIKAYDNGTFEMGCIYMRSKKSPIRFAYKLWVYHGGRP